MGNDDKSETEKALLYLAENWPAPVRTEITVLGADEPRKLKLNWKVKEYDGVEIHLGPPDHTPEMIMADGYRFPEGWEFEPILERDGLKAGDVVFIPSLVGGYNVLIIEERENAEDGLEALSRDGDYISFLRFGGDDRECWISWGGGNLGAIKKLELSS